MDGRNARRNARVMNKRFFVMAWRLFGSVFRRAWYVAVAATAGPSFGIYFFFFLFCSSFPFFVAFASSPASVRSDLERRFRVFSDKELSLGEFLVLLAPEYLFEEAKKRFLGGQGKGVSKVLREAVDLDGNGKVDLGEFIFFETLVRVPLHDIELTFRLFDLDNSGRLSQGEFLQVMDVVKGKYGLRPAGVTFALPSLFGKNGKKEVSFEEFRKWALALKREVARIEFDLLDADADGKISLRDFARFVMAYSGTEFGAALNDLAESNAFVSFEDFWGFQSGILENLSSIDDAIRLFVAKQEAISRPQFQRVVAAVSGGPPPPPQIVDVLFALFPSSSGTRLDRHAFVKAATLRSGRGVSSSSSSSSYWSCFGKCWQDELVTRTDSKF